MLQYIGSKQPYYNSDIVYTADKMETLRLVVIRKWWFEARQNWGVSGRHALIWNNAKDKEV